MKTLLKIKWSLLSYVFVNIFIYLLIAFIKMDMNFMLWKEGTRFGLVSFGILISIMVISAIWLWGKE